MLISRVNWGHQATRAAGAWTPSPLSPGGGAGGCCGSLSPLPRPPQVSELPGALGCQSLIHCHLLCPRPSAGGEEACRWASGVGGGPECLALASDADGRSCPAEQPVQRGRPGRGGAQHALQRHAAVLHVPAAHPHREARLQVDPRARHVLLRGLLAGQLLRQLVRPLPATARTLPRAGGRPWPRPLLSPLLGRAPLTAIPLPA